MRPGIRACHRPDISLVFWCESVEPDQKEASLQVAWVRWDARSVSVDSMGNPSALSRTCLRLPAQGPALNDPAALTPREWALREPNWTGPRTEANSDLAPSDGMRVLVCPYGGQRHSDLLAVAQFAGHLSDKVSRHQSHLLLQPDHLNGGVQLQGRMSERAGWKYTAVHAG